MNAFMQKNMTNEKPVEEEKVDPLPKFNIGDELFYLNDGKMETKKVTGIIKEYSRLGYYGPVERKFLHFNYCFDRSSSRDLGQWGWIPEDKVFISKQALIESL